MPARRHRPHAGRTVRALLPRKGGHHSEARRGNREDRRPARDLPRPFFQRRRTADVYNEMTSQNGPRVGRHPPIYRQLRDRVVAMILEGLLKEGDPLPSVRTVATDYRVNPLTVLKA